MTVGEQIAIMRERHGLSQAELAYRASTTQQAISRIERGAVSPTVEMLERLAAACGEELQPRFGPRAVPFEDAQLDEHARLTMSERLERACGWNRLASAIRGVAAHALADE